MKTSILCPLLYARIDPEKFQLHGLEIVWMNGGDTPENRAIAADVIANYETLAAEYLRQQAINEANATILAQLASLDAQRVRPLAEITLAQVAGEPMPLYSKAKLADIEQQAIALREKLK